MVKSHLRKIRLKRPFYLDEKREICDPKTIKKDCMSCGRELNWDEFLDANKDPRGFSYNQLWDIWVSPLTQFYCCTCITLEEIKKRIEDAYNMSIEEGIALFNKHFKFWPPELDASEIIELGIAEKELNFILDVFNNWDSYLKLINKLKEEGLWEGAKPGHIYNITHWLSWIYTFQLMHHQIFKKHNIPFERFFNEIKNLKNYINQEMEEKGELLKKPIINEKKLSYITNILGDEDISLPPSVSIVDKLKEYRRIYNFPSDYELKEFGEPIWTLLSFEAMLPEQLLRVKDIINEFPEIKEGNYDFDEVRDHLLGDVFDKMFHLPDDPIAFRNYVKEYGKWRRMNLSSPEGYIKALKSYNEWKKIAEKK
jgi:hypothetical protein